MPDDSPIEGLEDQQQGSEEAGGNGQSGPAQVDPSLIQSAIKEAVSPLAQTVEVLAGELQQLKAAREQAQQENAQQSASSDASDPISELATDPDGFVTKRVTQVLDEWAKQNIGPVVSLMLTEQGQKVETEARTSVDREFGEGTFDELVKPELDKLLANQDPRSRGFATIVNRAIDQIIGQNRSAFFERKQKAEEARKNDPEPLMSGGIRGSRGRDIEEEELRQVAKQWVSERNRAVGDGYSADELLRARKLGNTLSEWKAALQKEKGK